MENDNLVVVKALDVRELVEKADPLVAKANAVVVDSGESRRAALEGYKMLKITSKNIVEHYEPTRSALESAKKELLKARKAVTGPIEAAMKIIADKVTGYEREEERRAEEAARREREEERRRIEEERIASAEEAEKAGDGELADRLISEPVEVPERPVERAIEKVAGVSTREKYSAEVVDLEALLRHVLATNNLELVTPNMPALNAIARQMKAELAIPGVRVIVERVRVLK